MGDPFLIFPAAFRIGASTGRAGSSDCDPAPHRKTYFPPGDSHLKLRPVNHPTRMNFPALAESAIQKHSPFLHLDFHPAAVAALDEFFTVTWGESGLDNGQSSWTPTQGQRVAIVELGVFFGELVRRYFGGHWQEDVAQPERLLLASVGLPKGVQVFPVHHAWQRL